MAESDADAFVFFGATGDLAYEQILCAEDVGVRPRRNAWRMLSEVGACRPYRRSL